MERNNVILIGMPASGKSTVGVVLAKKLGYDFVDTDLCICKKYQKTLPQILEEYGYDKFLALENEVGVGIQCERSVIATGGSMVLSEEAMASLKRQGIVVWLDVDAKELGRRMLTSLEDRGVAVRGETTIEQLAEYRREFYVRYADMRIEEASDIEEIAEKIANSLNFS